jgi:hypothetical protein
LGMVFRDSQCVSAFDVEGKVRHGVLPSLEVGRHDATLKKIVYINQGCQGQA